MNKQLSASFKLKPIAHMVYQPMAIIIERNLDSGPGAHRT